MRNSLRTEHRNHDQESKAIQLIKDYKKFFTLTIEPIDQ